jgi:hypothetical protein
VRFLARVVPEMRGGFIEPRPVDSYRQLPCAFFLTARAQGGSCSVESARWRRGETGESRKRSTISQEGRPFGCEGQAMPDWLP